MNEKRRLGKTYVTVTSPWGLYPLYGHRLLCSDGVIRGARLAPTPDTFFSVPASVRVNGKNVSGYMTPDQESWIRGKKETDPFRCVYTFRQHNGQEHILPVWEKDYEKINNMIGKCYDETTKS